MCTLINLPYKYQSLKSYLGVKPWVLVDDLVPVGTLVNGGEPEGNISYLPSNFLFPLKTSCVPA